MPTAPSLPWTLVRRWIVVALCLLGMAACSDSKSTAPTADPRSLVGTWDWVHSLGGIGGWERTPDSVGYRETYTYRSNGIFELRRDNALELQVPYTIAKPDTTKSPVRPKVMYDFGYTPTWPPDQWIWSLEGDTLKLLDACYDCYMRTFVRIPTID